MRSPVPVLVPVLVALAVVAPVAAPVAGSGFPAGTAPSPVEPGEAHADDRTGVSPPNFTRPDPAVVVTIDLRANGDARWTVTSRFNVSNETDVAVFREFADTVAQGGRNGDLGYSAETFERFADRVENATNRSEEMAIRNASWGHRVENGTGHLSLQFTWTNFARTDGQQVILDDVFTAENGTWFDELSEGQRLVVNEPPGYSVESSPFPFTEGTIVLDGPRNVDTGGIPIVYTPTATPPTSTTPTTQGPLSPLALGGGFVVLVLGMVAALVLFSRRRNVDEEPAPGPGTGTTDGGETAGGTAAESPSGAGEATAEPEDGAADTGADAGTAGESAEGDEPEAEAIDEELLSDEERVERLLRRNGGRMKQANIVSETGWSNAKVSQLLSSMDEDDRIDKLRIGRENLITLPDEDVGELD